MANYELKIERFKEYSDSTLGFYTLYKNGTKIQTGYTCEPAGPDTIEANQDKRIPQGVYSMVWEASSMSGKDIIEGGLLPTIYNDLVSKSRKIKIHLGNDGEDTKGCILPGTGCNTDKGTVTNSRVALTALLKEIYPYCATISISNALMISNENSSAREGGDA